MILLTFTINAERRIKTGVLEVRGIESSITEVTATQ